MPFVTTRTQAARRAGRRRGLQQFEVSQLQSQYKQNILNAQSDLQTAQGQAAAEFSNLSKEYETGLAQYRDSLAAYEARGQAFSSKIDEYINTITGIERATTENTQRDLMVVGGLADILKPSWATFTDLAAGHTLKNGKVEFEEDVGGEGSFMTTTRVPLSQYDPNEYGGTVSSVLTSYDLVDVPATPADPGSFTETFDMRPPTAPAARSIDPERAEFERRALAEKDMLEREIGERRAGTIRARRRMTDRQMLQRS